ncbi:extracellular solute-binding protein [Natrarchaeobaculum sulfurireducens]|uniref:Tungstate ABC transporter, periplasmic substrate-binding protein WtpA n=1 Tax=Natrarchaeobaculum sulfurireducens TaxID=2044521 RepID=A0A346PQI4_9EURY|nr:extracellular solute-binding protein [Natrarchaeobaculum sulfurireducens]AXR81779.1 Tungstate ABC transporter, periplasmic substrate-binding protein WtpA [Natrarchaeobaculum sulfurireducens]
MGTRGDEARATHSRRSVLAAAAGVVGLAGSASLLAGRDRIRVLAAGSLAAALEDRIGPAFEAATDVRVDGEYLGTNAILRLIERGDTLPDVVIGADVSLVRDRLVPEHARFDLEFATNEVGIAYDPETDVGSRLAADEPWHEVLAAADAGAIGISDPDQNPLGYRAVHLFELAEREHDRSGFRDVMLERSSVDGQEGQLLGGLEAGNRACAISYRNMAADRDLPFYALPTTYNFADPAFEDVYATASYTTADGQTVTGSLVSYTATVLDRATEPENGQRFVAFLGKQPSLLEGAGLEVPESLPRPSGDFPEVIQP